MCGRYSYHFSWPELWALLDLPGTPLLAEPRYNVAPTQSAPVVRDLGAPDKQVDFLSWGITPRWSAGPRNAPLLINARAETAANKPTFRQLLKSKRCVVPASGYYEWQPNSAGGSKQPYFISGPGILLFAALWDSGPEQDCFTILTTAANATVAMIHDRMPVILSADEAILWLDRDGNTHNFQNLLQPREPSAALIPYKVGPLVGSFKNDSAECIVPMI